VRFQSRGLIFLVHKIDFAHVVKAIGSSIEDNHRIPKKKSNTSTTNDITRAQAGTSDKVSKT
jgi:hypothetical protein